MKDDKRRPTPDELYELLKRSSLPTVLVEGKNDIIFYRKVEEELQELGVDMLPAGNKDAVLEVRRRIREDPISAPIVFVVDKDLWVHSEAPEVPDISDVITTEGYSVENDLFIDGELTALLSADEKLAFETELRKFLRWYALAVHRTLNGNSSAFRTHPGKILDDALHYAECLKLESNEAYPERFLDFLLENYPKLLRGKSLFALLHRQLSRKKRKTKFGESQLMEIGAARMGPNFQRIKQLVSARIQAQ